MTSKLGIYNAALFIIKERKLSLITDSVESRRLLDDVYDDTLAYMIEGGLWDFARRSVELSNDEGVTPDFGYSYAFERPSDYVRLVSLSANERQRPQLEDFTEEGSYWLANVDTLYLTYTSNDTAYGYDMSGWPMTFVRAFEHELALRIAPRLTAMSDAALQMLERKAINHLRNARAKSAMNHGIKRLPTGRMSQARGGGHTRWRDN